MRKQKQNRLPSRSYARLGLIVAFVITGAVGVWLTFGINAKENPPTGSIIPDVSHGNYFYIPAGTTVTHPVSASTRLDGNRAATQSFGVILFSDPKAVDYKGYECPSDIKCFNAKSDSPTPLQDYGSLHANLTRVDQVICMNYTPDTRLGEATYRIDVKYKSKMATPWPSTLWRWTFFGILPNNMCKQGVDITGVKWGLNMHCDPCYVAPSPKPKGSKPSNATAGKGGSGNGSGGSGNGTGTQGTGSGKNGTGSSGGGSSATKQSESPKPTPTPSPQGAKETDPPQQEPSPFFDGKQYSIGSDPDAQTPADLVTNPGKVFVNVWFYVIGGITAIGIGIGGWLAWKRHYSNVGAKK